MTVKDLRKRTGMPIAMCASAWKASGEDMTKAIELLKEKGASKASSLSQRETKAGYIGLYRHHDGKSVGYQELLCETDFVANTQEFRILANNLAMQLVSVEGDEVMTHEEILAQESLLTAGMTVKQKIEELSVQTGEKISLGSSILGRI